MWGFGRGGRGKECANAKEAPGKWNYGKVSNGSRGNGKGAYGLERHTTLNRQHIDLRLLRQDLLLRFFKSVGREVCNDDSRAAIFCEELRCGSSNS